MKFWSEFFEILDTGMAKPQMYGWFHWLFLALTGLACVVLCRQHKKPKDEEVQKLIFWTSLIAIIFEVYKQVNFSFGYRDGIVTFDYQWYAFPFQFCSMPMYVGFLAGIIRRGKLYDSLCAFLGTYSVFAGICVMLYPNTVFVETIGINIQTMYCHGSMIVLGVFLLYTNYVKSEHRTMLKAMPVFSTAVLIAVFFNEVAHQTGLLETETFDMFFISPYCEPSLPVYSLVQKVVPFPLCLVIYILGFTAASYLILLVSMLAKRSVFKICARGKKRVACK